MSEDLKGTVIVYSVVGCQRCESAKRHLSKLRIPYMDISLDSFPQCRDEMERLCGSTDTPQIFFNEVHIGDEEGLKALVGDVARFDAMMEMLRTEESPQEAPSLPQPQTSVDYQDEDENTSMSGSDSLFLCIPNEYSRLVASMKKANVIKDNRVGSTIYRNSFKGEHFISWIMQQRHIKLKDALEIGQELIERQYGRQMSKESGELFSPERQVINTRDFLKNQNHYLMGTRRYYQLHTGEESVALNASLVAEQTPISAKELNQTLVTVLEPLYNRILTDDRKSIKYVAVEDNDYFQEYIAISKDIQWLNVLDATATEKTAIFVNIYNIMLIHIFTKYGPPNNVWQRRKLLNTTYYVIGGQLYSLQSILNGILRANRRGVNMLWEPFGSQDRRLHLALNEPQPLVHFAINYGTKSGPPIRLYSTENVIEEMRIAAREFLSSDDNLRIDVKKSIVFLPSVFNWYADDFGHSKQKIIEWVVNILGAGEKKANLIKVYRSKTLTIDYLNYDWTHNII